MDFQKLDQDTLSQFLTTDYSSYGLPTPEESAKDIFDHLVSQIGSIQDESIPIPIQDLYLASIYNGPRNVKYTQHDILNLDQDQVNQFQKIFGFHPSDLTTDRQRVLRILTYLDLIYYQSEDLLEPTLRQTLCDTLPLDDLYHLMQAYNFKTLDCIIPVNDKDGKITHIMGLNNASYKVIKSINENGTIETIYLAIGNNDPRQLDIIIKNTQDKNILKTPKGSILYLNNAITAGGIEIVKYLLEHLDLGLELEPSYDYQLNPLNTAAETGILEIVDLLSQNGAPIDNSTFIMAIRSGNPEMVKYFIDQGVDVDAVDRDNSPMITLPLKYQLDKPSATQIIKLLVEAGANPDVNDPYGNPLIQQIIRKGWVDLVNYLIGLERIDLSTTDLNNDTAINVLINHTFSITDYRQAIQETLKQGWYVNHTPNSSFTPLTSAIVNYIHKDKSHLLSVIQILLDNGADINQIHVGAINEIFKFNRTELLEYLLEHGLDPNIHDGILLGNAVDLHFKNPTPKRLELIQSLLEQGVEIPNDRMREYLTEIGAI